MNASQEQHGSEFYQLALGKMAKVLGEARARELLTRLCEEANLTLATADELFQLAAALSKLGGFEGAVGALLSVQAVMRGARGR